LDRSILRAPEAGTAGGADVVHLTTVLDKAVTTRGMAESTPRLWITLIVAL